MSDVPLSSLSLRDVAKLADRGLFAFAECATHGFVFVSVQKLDDGWRATCGECQLVIPTSSTVRFLTREAARAHGWHITTDVSVRRA